MITARTTERSPAPAADWLQPIAGLGVDGAVAMVLLLVAHDPLLTRILALSVDESLILAYWAAISIVLGCLLWQRFGDHWVRWSLRHLWPILLVLLVALASPLWSLDPARSATRAGVLLASTFLGFFIGYRFYARDLMSFLLVFFAIVLGSSVLAALLLPEVGVHPLRGGSWSGLVRYKGTLGHVAALAIAFFVIGVLYGRLPRALGLLLLGLAIFVLVNTKSATGMIVAVAALGLIVILWLGKLFRVSALLAVALMVASPVVMVAAVVNLETVATWFDRDPSLTGRTKAWADAIEIIGERPLTGFGLEAIWGKQEETPFPYRPTTRSLGHAHNGYLDLADELGVPVALFATLYMFYLLFVSLNTYLSTRSSVALFALISLNSFLLFSFVEAGLFEYRRIEWILCVATIVAMLRRATDGPSLRATTST
jgi:exopolysaccharide production protein ExoQ